MARLIMVCGGVGAGKTTHALALCKDIGAIRFSIDPWMQTLYAKDMKSLDYTWMLDRVNRCYQQIWDISEQILLLDGNVILDLGFTTQESRQAFYVKARHLNIEPELHYLEVDTSIRKRRVKKRNKDRDPAVYSFEVTNVMFNFMEPKFEEPSSAELKNVVHIKQNT